jgi:hypothetical protein
MVRKQQSSLLDHEYLRLYPGKSAVSGWLSVKIFKALVGRREIPEYREIRGSNLDSL